MKAADWDEIRDRTVALYARPGFGGGRLPEVLDESQVRQAEAHLGIEFPEDYRQYLLRVSAGGQVRTLRSEGSCWDWEGARYKDHDTLHVPFPAPDSTPVTEEALDDEWVPGAVFLRDDGCGYHTLLVVSGPMRGTMWFDGRAASDRLHPLPNDERRAATFAEWYLDWLTHEEALTTPEQRRAAFRRWETGVDKPIWYRWFDA
ncbi:SMI1/KNR4 family protein [Amycolatopsis sp. NPDC089917]|uniref:SMI1/KNR4 family protein n=1 Tax=Amycolatopsis sp. NPDC089917 TaxID=3155187 RepID=UPI003422A373